MMATKSWFSNHSNKASQIPASMIPQYVKSSVQTPVAAATSRGAPLHQTRT